jgi:hypothetical protein
MASRETHASLDREPHFGARRQDQEPVGFGVRDLGGRAVAPVANASEARE